MTTWAMRVFGPGAKAAGMAWMAMMGLGPTGATAQAVDFPDHALESAVLQELGLSRGPITREALGQLVELRVVGAGVESLVGLDQAPNLRKLVVGANRIRDLGPLAGLSRLEELHAWFNQIEDLRPLEDVRTLTQLQLGANRISDLTPLRSLDRLTHLDVAANDVVDLSPLEGLTALRWIEASDNRIEDLTPLAGLAGLRKLWLWRNRIADVSPLGGLDELRWLKLGANELGDVSAVLQLPRLATLSVHDNYLDVSRPALVRSIEALQSEGVRVRIEPQRTASFWATSEDGRGQR